MQSSVIARTRPLKVQPILEKLPPLSPTLTLLLATLSREDVSFAKISDLIEQDPVLAGNVLGLVNSSLYGRRGRVSSVRYAVSLLGVMKLRNAALAMSVTRMWNKQHTPPTWSMPNFNRHSLAVAMLSDLLAQEARVEHPEGAFVAGLLHDLGKLMIAACLAQEYAEIAALMAETGRSALECETDVLGCTHATLSGDALGLWSLPAEIERAVRYHHSPELDAAPADPQTFRLSYAVATADEYANQLGWGASGYAPAAERQAAYPMEALGIRDVQRVLDVFHEEAGAISSFL